MRGIHRSPVNSSHKGQWRGALMFSLICTRINSWVNNGEGGDLRRYRAHYDVTVMVDSPFLDGRVMAERFKTLGIITDGGLPWDSVGQRKKVTAVTFFPARPRPDQRGTNTGQIRKVPLYEIAWFLVYRMGETRSQLSANNGILVCLVREIWQFKLFAGKEVTAVPATRGEEGYW